MPVEKCLVRPSLRLRRYRPVRRLIYFPDALLETRKRSGRKGAVFLNRVPAVFDTAHVGFVFADIIRDGHCGARTCMASPFDETQAFMAPAREPNPIWSGHLCRPTAPGLPIWGPGTSVRRRFSGSSRTSRCLPVSEHLGCRNVKHNARLRYLPTKKRFLCCRHRRPFSGPEAAATPAENSR
jgi:hypothetical protein